MDSAMAENSSEIGSLVEQAAGGDQRAMGALFDRFRDRLKKMVRLRLNRRLRGRVDDSDVVQDAFLDAARRLDDYLRDPQVPFFLWLQIGRAHV